MKWMVLVWCAFFATAFSFEMHWEKEGGIFSFKVEENEVFYSVDLKEEAWDLLPQKIQKQFDKTDRGYFFSSNRSVPGFDLGENYAFGQKRVLRKANPTLIDTNQFLEWVRTKNIIFYTGAGISAAAGIPTMDELEKLFQSDQHWAQRAVSDSKQIFQKIRFFYEVCHCSSPTVAHVALKNIALTLSIPLLTENLDQLHQKSGIQPLFVTAEAVKKEISLEKLKSVDAIVCIGMSRDEKGFLDWYKTHQPKGKLIAIDLQKPSYLGKEDLLLIGDVQEIIPQIEAQLLKKKKAI